MHRVLTIGAIRQGELWESTAIPELRQQAADRRRAARGHGPVARGGAAAASTRAGAARHRRTLAYAEGVRRLLGVQHGASRAFLAAVAEAPDHARAHAALALLATERPGGTRAGGRRRRGAAPGPGPGRGGTASDDDRSHVEALGHVVRARQPARDERRSSPTSNRCPDDTLALRRARPVDRVRRRG